MKIPTALFGRLTDTLCYAARRPKSSVAITAWSEGSFLSVVGLSPAMIGPYASNVLILAALAAMGALVTVIGMRETSAKLAREEIVISE